MDPEISRPPPGQQPGSLCDTARPPSHRQWVQQMFQRTVKRAKLGKRVTPHTLRHTAATLLLRNGCPIGYIKEVLGHSRLETTCRYYLGVLNKVDTKRAFDQYMLIGDDSSLTR